MGTGSSSGSGNSNLPPVLPSLKIALVGDPGVGKTSVLVRYLRNQFSPLYIPTKKVAIENIVRKLNVPANTVVSLTLWDIPGREDMDIHKSYFRNLDAAIVIVDLTSKASIEMANVWKQTVLNRLTRDIPSDSRNNGEFKQEVPVSTKNFPVLLLGNKFDIIQEEIERDIANKQVSVSMDVDGLMELQHESITLLEDVAQEHDFIGSVTVSAKKADGSITAAIQSLVRNILEKRDIPRKWKAVPPKPKPPKKDRPFIYDKLDKTDIEKIDSVIEKADGILKQTVMLRHYHTVALSRFKHACYKGGLLSDEDPSLEDCIQAMKTGTKQGSLKIVVDDGFFKLEVTFDNGEETKQSKPWKQSYRIFHNEYAAVCKVILREGPKLSAALEKYSVALDPYQHSESVEVCNQMVRNTAKVTHAMEEMKLTLDQVEAEGRKITNVERW